MVEEKYSSKWQTTSDVSYSWVYASYFLHTPPVPQGRETWQGAEFSISRWGQSRGSHSHRCLPQSGHSPMTCALSTSFMHQHRLERVLDRGLMPALSLPGRPAQTHFLSMGWCLKSHGPSPILPVNYISVRIGHQIFRFWGRWHWRWGQQEGVGIW